MLTTDLVVQNRRRFVFDITMIRELCERAEACLAQDRYSTLLRCVLARFAYDQYSPTTAPCFSCRRRSRFSATCMVSLAT